MAAMFKPIRAVMTAALLTIATYGVAAEMAGGHPDTYVVKRGDTLWDIAGKFLKRPWLWPEIWQANPQIRNPHLIYPGDVISLAYLNRVAVQEGPREEAPINAIPLADVEKFLKDLRVVDKFDDLPTVAGLEDDRLRAGEGQVAYVHGLTDARPGQRYMVVRPTQTYASIDPTRCCGTEGRRGADLDFRGRANIGVERLWGYQIPHGGGEFLGHELMRQNTGTITRGVEGRAEVATLLLDQGGREVRVGDRLLPVEAQPYDLQFMPHAPAREIEYGKAKVLAVADMLTTGGPRDVVALSVGARDGVNNGTVFSTWRPGSNAADVVKHGAEYENQVLRSKDGIQLPDEFAGHLMVFRTFDKVSYALVMDAVKPTRLGYELKHPDAAY